MGILRCFLAIIVIIDHTSPFLGLTFIGGTLAVQSFYIISGFYMSLILNEKYINKNNSYKLYITNRLLRLYPIYWAVLLIIVFSSLVLFFFTNGEKTGALEIFFSNFENLKFSSLVILIFTNIFIFFQDVLLFFQIGSNGLLQFQPNFNLSKLPAFNFSLIPQAWTVGLELWFYLIAPFIVKRKTWLLILLIVISFTFNLYLTQGLKLNYTPWNFRFFPSEIIFFIIGALSYKIYKNNLFKKYIIFKKLIYILFIILILLFNFLDFIEFSILKNIYFFTLFLIIPILFKNTKHIKIDRLVGELSYPIYINHLFLISILTFTKITYINNVYFVCILSIIFSYILNLTISKRIEAYRQKRVLSK